MVSMSKTLYPLLSTGSTQFSNFRGMTVGFVSCHLNCIALHSVNATPLEHGL